MSLESEVHDNTLAMKELLNTMKGGFGGGSNIPSSSSTSGGSLKTATDGFVGNVGNAAEAALSFAGKLATGTARVPDVAKTLDNAVTPFFGKFAKVFGDSAVGVTEFVDTSVRNWQDFTKLGPTMYGNFMNLNKVISQTGTSYEMLNDIMKNMQGGQLAFGKNMTESVINFGNFTEALRNNQEASTKLNMLGFRTEDERAKLAAAVLRNNIGLNLDNKAAQDLVIERMKDMAKQMAVTAEMTGVSRTQQLENLDRFNSSLQILGLRQEALNKGDYRLMAVLEDVKTAVTTQPKAVGDAIAIGMARKGNVYDDTDAKALSTLNMIAPMALQKIRDQTAIASDQSRTDAERKAAAKELQNINKEVIIEAAKGILPSLLTNKQLSPEQEAFVRENQGLITSMQNLQAKYQGSKTDKELIEEAVDSATLATNGVVGTPGIPGVKPGEVDPGRQSTQFYLNLNDRLRDLGTTLVSTLSTFNRELGVTNGILEKTNLKPYIASKTGLEKELPKAGETISPRMLDEVIQKRIQDMMNQKATETQPKDKSSKDSKTVGDASIPQADRSVASANLADSKAIVASIQENYRILPQISASLTRVTPDMVQAVTTAMNDTSKDSGSSQDILLEEVKKLNTVMQTVAGFNKATADGITKTYRAIEATNSAYG